MPFARTTDGIRIHYELHGEGPINLVFLHGNGGPCGTLWDGVIGQLDPRQFRSVVLEYRGFGRSDVPDEGYNWEIFGNDVLALADEIQAEHFVPVGFSFGGKLACYIASKHRNRIPAQVLIAPVAPGTSALSREAGLQLCRDAGDWKKVRPVFRNLWFGSSVNEQLLDTCCQATAEIQHIALEGTVEMALWTSIASEIGKLKLPTLVVAGNDDPTYGMKYQGEQMLPFLEHFQTLEVHSGHFIPLERPVELSRVLRNFCNEVTTL
jgi:pimeloyl-ACP methyl ester carboxylesterase